MNFLVGGFFARPAVEALRPAVPVGNFPRRIGDDDGVVREVEQLGVVEKFLAHIGEVALGAGFADDATDGENELGRVRLGNEIGRPGDERVVHLRWIGGARKENEGDVGRFFAGEGERTEAAGGRTAAIGQDDVGRAFERGRQFGRGADVDEVALERAFPQLGPDQGGVGLIGFEMNNPQ